MKKIAKLSLVAAVAVAGLSTTASAQALEEAIKNVDVSGTVVYRYDDKATDVVASDTDNKSSNYYKVAVSLKSKVTDDVAFNSRVLVADAKGGFAAGGLETNGGDANPGLTLSHANFAYTGVANTTVVVGKQGLPTPFTKVTDSDGSEQTGTGALALSTMGPITVAGGYFNQTNLTDGGEDLAVVAVLGNMGPVSAKAYYIDLDETFSQYFVKASAKVGPASIYAQYSDRDTDGLTANDDISLLKVGASAKVGMFNAGIAYAETGKNGSGIINAVSENSAIGYTVDLSKANNSSAIFVDLGAQVTDKLHIGLNYDEVSDDDTVAADDHKEYFTQITYNHAKNLSAYVRIATGEDGTTDYNRGRLQVEYKF